MRQSPSGASPDSACRVDRTDAVDGRGKGSHWEEMHATTLKGVAYGAALVSAGAVMTVAVTRDFGLRPDLPRLDDVPALVTPDIARIATPGLPRGPTSSATTQPRPSGSTQPPRSQAPPLVPILLPSADNPLAPGDLLTPDQTPEPDQPPAVSPPPSTGIPSPPRTPVPSPTPSGKPRPCGLVVDHQSGCASHDWDP